MANQVFKVVLNYTADDSNESSWSEVYYTSQVDLTHAITATDSLVQIRVEFLHKLNNLRSARISQFLTPRAAIPRTYNVAGANPVGNPMTAGEAIILRLASTNAVATRHLWMRGCSDQDAFRSPLTGQTVFGTGFNTVIPQFFAALSANGFMIPKRFSVTDPGADPHQIIGIIPTVAFPTCGIVYMGLPIASGQTGQVIITRTSTKDFPGLNGIWKILSQSTVTSGPFTGFQQIVIAYNLPGAPVAPLPANGSIRSLTYDFGQGIDPMFCVVEYLNTRQTKGPGGGSRGAKRANRRLRTSP